MRKSRIEICTLLAALLLWAMPAFGQLTAGSVAGTVVDSTGAAVPNASVELRNTDTGVSYQHDHQ